MKNHVGIVCIGLTALSLMLGLGFWSTGCESSDRTEAVRQTKIDLTPTHTELAIGESAVFTASGWHDYRWSLRHENIGSLSHRAGDETRYTSIDETNTFQVLTVSAVISGTNSTRVSAQAVILHK